MMKHAVLLFDLACSLLGYWITHTSPGPSGTSHIGCLMNNVCVRAISLFKLAKTVWQCLGALRTVKPLGIASQVSSLVVSADVAIPWSTTPPQPMKLRHEMRWRFDGILRWSFETRSLSQRVLDSCSVIS
ncbi:hypothetical protein BU25DRAFT_68517 [Macroventuria anomochaeta]|uniref:Uncharacterized protein n=1 Tax=Macroventuria anomochaeta TaxID=301207 RepID=A0ACB6S1Q8_9PLEO|nr:uncharacterized protein BU25DRAFT_68517 [Macroventuria anomochaeta]KAF2627067.1 hypothetical protein BU25DRAFT_68517 [Macroventuria anomochaeta]